MTTLNRDAAERGGRARVPLRHRRHRVRPARPRAQAGPGQRCHGGHRLAPPCRTSTGPARRPTAGYISGGTRRNLDWVRPHTRLDSIDELEALLLADAQTSGGLLVAGEIPGAPVIGELVPRREHLIVVR